MGMSKSLLGHGKKDAARPVSESQKEISLLKRYAWQYGWVSNGLTLRIGIFRFRELGKFLAFTSRSVEQSRKFKETQSQSNANGLLTTQGEASEAFLPR